MKSGMRASGVMLVEGEIRSASAKTLDFTKESDVRPEWSRGTEKRVETKRYLDDKDEKVATEGGCRELVDEGRKGEIKLTLPAEGVKL